MTDPTDAIRKKDAEIRSMHLESESDARSFFAGFAYLVASKSLSEWYVLTFAKIVAEEWGITRTHCEMAVLFGCKGITAGIGKPGPRTRKIDLKMDGIMNPIAAFRAFEVGFRQALEALISVIADYGVDPWA